MGPRTKRSSSSSSTPLRWLFALLVLMIAVAVSDTKASEYPGVIELVGYSNRRARTHYTPNALAAGTGTGAVNPTLAPPQTKTQADIETVKQNIEKYNKLLTLDTRNLPDSQKDMLERIVERVARLKESLDIGADEMVKPQQQQQQQQQTDSVPTTEASTKQMAAESETDPTLILDETTLLQLQTSMDELAAAQASVTAQTTRMRDSTAPPTTDITLTDAESDETSADDGTAATATATNGNSEYSLPTTTLDPIADGATLAGTDGESQFVVARSNNHNSIAAITAADTDTDTSEPEPGTTVNGSQRTLTTSGKLTKTRATKRPAVGHKVTSTSTAQGIRGQRPPVGSSAAGLHKQTLTSSGGSTTTTKHKQSTQGITTTQPLQYHKQQKVKPQPQSQYYQQKQQTANGEKISSAAQTAASSAATSSYASSVSGPTTTPVAVRNPAYAAGNLSGGPAVTYNASPNSNTNDMVYDAHVNASAIIDSLNNAREEYYQQKQTINGANINNKDKDKKPSSATAKPTKYHYYPHNQHIYLLPECAIQQVCNAVYVRLNYTQPLCACPSRYRDPCSASLNEDDQHTTKLVGDGKKKAITLAKTCEATTEMRECRSPKDWSLLALQNTRTGKSHYLVICRCPDHFKMEGPMAHDQPTYASVPGIRVFGMMCVKPGYSVRKPSAQPPKRYQLQKPFYRPGTASSSSSYISNNHQYINNNKDAYGRPISASSSSSSAASSNYHPEDVYQSQHQANYQYLNRPDSVVSIGNYRPDASSLPQSINNFQGGIYGRNNERKGDAPIEAATEDDHEQRKVATATNIPLNGAVNDDDAQPKRTTALDELAGATTAAADESDAQTTISNGKREKRSANIEPVLYEFDDDTPEFPWDRVIEFQQSIVWD